MTSPLPSGTVTFLFTDIEGSTALWEHDSAAMRAALDQHDAILREAIESRGGYVFKTVGDAFCAAFERARDALEAAYEAQLALEASDWRRLGDQGPLRARMGLHSGEAEERKGDYFGPPLNRVARLMSVGHGGQILVSMATQQLVRDALPEACWLEDLGEHELKDLKYSEGIFILRSPDLISVDRAPKTSDTAAVSEPRQEISGKLVWSAAGAGRKKEASKLLAEHPLASLDCVTLYLDDHGMKDRPATRAAALKRVLEGVAYERLKAWRTELGQAEDATSATLFDQVRQDYTSGSRSLACLSAFYAHDLSTNPLSLDALEDLAFVADRSAIYRHRRRGAALLAEALLAEEAAARLELAERDAPALEDRLIIDPDAPERAPNEDLDRLLEVVRDDRRRESFTARILSSIAHMQPANFEQYWTSRVAEWSQERYRLDERFVRLSMMVDVGEEVASGRWKTEDRQFDSLEEILGEVAAPAMVVLGAPGSGKSTLLRHFEMRSAEAALKAEHKRITFFVPLGRFGMSGDPPDPRAWLELRWAERYPDLPALSELVATGEVVLLLDALNEMPHHDTAQYRERVLTWKRFIQETVERAPDVRIIFSCRSLDYSAPLSSPELRVPQVRVEPLDDEQIQEFLNRYLPERHGAVWSALSVEGQQEVFRTPYLLRLLVDQVWETDVVPEGRAALFTGFVRKALRREIELNNLDFEPPTLLSERDYFRVVNARSWPNPYLLPEQGPFFPLLSRLAFEMQRTLATREMAQVRLTFEDVEEMVGEDLAEQLLSAAVGLSVLTEDRMRDEVMFFHQLLQEYFAARHLRRKFDPELVKVKWLEAEVSRTVEETIATLAPADPLPPLPTTGWEETTILATAMARGADAMVSKMMKVNLPLAGRCVAQGEVQVSDELKDELRWALVERSRDPETDLRARIEAGEALGEIGDPRFTRGVGPEGDEYLLPPMVEIPGGVYTIGCDDGPYPEEEAPEHQVEIAPFKLAKFPVTNAEWALFMRAGGYDDERWWDTEDAKLWRQGVGTMEGARWNQRLNWQRWEANPDVLEEVHARGEMPTPLFEQWRRLLSEGVASFEVHLKKELPDKGVHSPEYWRAQGYSGRCNPVVGVSWYEARAYCSWLAWQSSSRLRLPTEVEWESAARGLDASIYSYGMSFDRTACNTFERHLRRPSPVGVFPAGDSPRGHVDMVGNTLDWTTSLFGLESGTHEFRYPYERLDGRELVDAAMHVLRIARGGGWGFSRIDARSACRYWAHPAARFDVIGLRLAENGLSP